MTITFFRFLLPCFSLAAITIAHAGGMDNSGIVQPQLRISLKNTSLSPSITVMLFNPNARPVEISYSECDFSYQMRHDAESVNYPMKEPFKFASPCPGSLKVRTLPSRRTLVLFERKLNAESLRIVKMNGMKIYGEYHFRFSIRYTGKQATSIFVAK